MASTNVFIRDLIDKAIEPTAIQCVDAKLAVQLFADQANKYIDAIARSKHHRIDTNKLREC